MVPRRTASLVLIGRASTNNRTWVNTYLTLPTGVQVHNILLSSFLLPSSSNLFLFSFRSSIDVLLEGMIHISDDCAYRCTGHTTGMNMEFFIQRPPNQRPPKPVLGSCCQFDSTKGTGMLTYLLLQQNTKITKRKGRESKRIRPEYVVVTLSNLYI